MSLVPIKTVHGEGKAWDILSGLPPEDVCRKAGVSHDSATNSYRVRSFGMDFCVSLKDRDIRSSSPASGLLLEKLRDFSRLSILWYLVTAKDIPPTGRLKKPIDIKGGQRFSAGTHLLPLSELAETFGNDREAFLERGRKLGGEVLTFGDASIRLFPLPRVPITVILWLEDREFPARADLLFDSTADFQIESSDIVWSVAMMSAMAMLLEG